MIRYYAIFLKNKAKFKPLASLIRFIEGLDFNHVEILEVVDGKYESAMSYGVTFSGSRSIMVDDLKKDYELKEIVELKVTNKNPQALLNKLIGIKYAFLQMGIVGVKIAIKSIAKLISKMKVNGQNGLICTEEAALFISSACEIDLDQSSEVYSLREVRALAYKNMVSDFESDSLKVEEYFKK